MLSSREGSTKSEYQCDRCYATDGKKHPATGFIVHLKKQITDGKMMALCQKCNFRMQTRSRYNHFERTRSQSIEEVKNRVHHLFNP